MENKMSKTNLIQETDFNNAWYEAIKVVLKNKSELIFGSLRDPKEAYDSCQMIELTGNAIKQIERHEIHPQYQFKSIEQYVNELTYEFAIKQSNMMYYEKEKHDYNYAERLMLYNVNGYRNNQILRLENLIKIQQENKISSNFTQAITWYTDKDGNYIKSSPCLQRIWMRWYPGDLIDLHLEWRSRDLYNAWQANIIAIAEMINREVIEPNNCKLARIIDYSDSLHIYKGDIEQASLVQKIDTFHGV